MKRSQINYVIDKAHAIAQTFRVCLPEFAYFTVDDWLQRERDNWQEVVDLQLGWVSPILVVVISTKRD